MPSGVTGTGLPSASPTPSQSITARRAIALAKTSARSSSEAVSGSASTARIAAGRHHQRGGERCDAQAHAVAEVEPARLGGQVQPQHGQYSSMSLTSVAVHMRPSVGVPGRLPVEGRLHALRAGDLDPRPRQVDRVHGEGEALARGQRVAELELARVAGDRLVHQHLVGEADLDAAGERGDRRIGAVDAAVARGSSRSGRGCWRR